MPLWKNKKLGLTEQEIWYAIENTRNATEAAEFIGCSLPTFKKYAKKYTDPDSGKDLYAVAKDQNNKRHPHIHDGWFAQKDIYEILEGKHPTYGKRKLKKRLLKEGIFEERCMNCGFDERRVTDNTVPLIMVCKNGDDRDYRKDNLEFLCYNCFYLMYDDLKHMRKMVGFDGYWDD